MVGSSAMHGPLGPKGFLGGAFVVAEAFSLRDLVRRLP
jgi:hypothetical protein